MTGDVPTKLVDAAYKYQGNYLHMEDVTFTGILAESLDINRINHPSFVHHWLPAERACSYKNLITVHRVKTVNDLRNYAGKCFQ